LNKYFFIILIPIFNDWKSLEKLIKKIELSSQDKGRFLILIIDDCSTTKCSLKKKFQKIKKIKILRLTQNVGSQKAIAIGLDYIEKNFFKSNILIMDGDGEDDPSEIKRMLFESKKHPDLTIVSCRLERKEIFFIKFFYKIHLIIVFLFTFRWISFGNFSCLNSQNLNKLFKDESLYLAYSAAVIKNSKIKRLYSKRDKRFSGKSKVSFLKLIEHSLRILSVFNLEIFVSSSVYVATFIFFFKELSILFILFFLIINCTIFFIKKKHKPKNISTYNIKKFTINKSI